MKYKLLALDIDGTLTNHNKEITGHTRHAIIRLQKSGVRVVLASGRPAYGIEAAAKELELERYGGFILAYNGGRIVDCSSGSVIYEQTIPVEMVGMIYDKIKDKNAALMTYEGDAIITERAKDRYVLKESFINQMQIKMVDNFKDYVRYPPVKCLVAADESYLIDVEKELKRYFGGQLSIYCSEPYFLEIMSNHVDKAVALERLLKYTGIERRRTAACGDGLNDISMLRYAGLSIAMANAGETVKQVCDCMTRSNDDEGVAYAINHFIME